MIIPLAPESSAHFIHSTPCDGTRMMGRQWPALEAVTACARLVADSGVKGECSMSMKAHWKPEREAILAARGEGRERRVPSKGPVWEAQ